MFLKDEIQLTLRSLNKITENEVVQKIGDVYVAINVIDGKKRVLLEEKNLIKSLLEQKSNIEKQILKG
tara:strand:+ start:644 stop:847 length:204 start_codon:yes stop_codon:yes gene_type:complete